MPPKKKEKPVKPEPPPVPPPVDPEADLALLQLQHKNLKQKFEKMERKLYELNQDNERLRLDLVRRGEDRDDLYEEMKRMIDEREEERNRNLDRAIRAEEEKERAELELESKLEAEKQGSLDQINKLKEKIANLEDELQELHDFKTQKHELESDLDQTKKTLADDRKEHMNAMSELDRKIVQEKDRLKKEMLNKIKEAKANLLKMTDSQLASTTKRTILENEQMTTELAYQSKRTTELVQKNEKLKKENLTLKRNMELMMQEQEEIAKRNNSSQKVIKMLLNKLKIMESSKLEERSEMEIRKDTEIKTLMDELTLRDERIEQLTQQIDGLKDQLIGEINSKEIIIAEQYKMISVLNDAANFILSFIEEGKTTNRPKSTGNAMGIQLPEDQSTSFSETARSWGVPSTPDEIKLADQERMLRFLLAKLSTLQSRAQTSSSRNHPSLPPIANHRGEPQTPHIPPPSSRPPTTPAFLGFGSPLPDTPRTARRMDSFGGRSVATQTDFRGTISTSESADRQSAPTTLEVLAGTVRPWGKRIDTQSNRRYSPDTYLRRGHKIAGVSSPHQTNAPPDSTVEGQGRTLV